MDLVTILITLVIFALIGFIVYLITTYIPMPDPFKQVITVGTVILLVVYLILLLAGRLEPVRFGGRVSRLRDSTVAPLSLVMQ